MDVEWVPPSRLLHVWPEASAQIQRAAKYDPEFDLDEILKALLSGEFQLWQSPNGFGVTGIRLRDGAKHLTFRIFYVAGTISSVCESRLNCVRRIMRNFEEIARTGRCGAAIGNKCAEIRLEGRKGWKKALPEYEMQGLSNGNYEFWRGL